MAIGFRNLSRQKVFITGVIVVALGFVAKSMLSNLRGTTAGPQTAPARTPALVPESPGPGKTFKVLHVMSYHQPWKWTQEQFDGFKDALSDLPVEYRVVEMDAKRNSAETWKQDRAAQAMHQIDTWQPDLVFTGDDVAQQYVTTRYLNTAVPFVFCAVNADPTEYEFHRAANVTGVLERMHFVQTVNLLRQLVPSVRKIALITDTGAMWIPMIEQLKTQQAQLEGVEVVSYDILETFSQYQQAVLGYQDKVDALGFLGIFEFKDEQGNNVLLEDVLHWTVENSQLPDFAFWKDRVDKGTLCAVTVSGLAQGEAAGRIARGILLGQSPKDYPMQSTETGLPVINLARARKLDINPDASVLLTAQVVTEIP